jgi:hypothetical protein
VRTIVVVIIIIIIIIPRLSLVDAWIALLWRRERCDNVIVVDPDDHGLADDAGPRTSRPRSFACSAGA